MKASPDGSQKSGMTAGFLLAGAVVLLALPSAVLAFTARFDPEASSTPEDSIESIDNADSGTGNLSRPVPMRSLAKGKLFPFTPAGSPNRPDRSVTVAVRVDPQAAQVMAARRLAQSSKSEAEGGELRIAPTAFNLGVARGYRNFSQTLAQPENDRVGLASSVDRFSIAPGKGGDESRFSPHIVIDETQGAGRAPRTYGGDSDDRVDVGGSYRLTRNIDVTAGVRYSQERERLLPPLTDGAQDNQAVYVGTQFRF